MVRGPAGNETLTAVAPGPVFLSLERGGGGVWLVAMCDVIVSR